MSEYIFLAVLIVVAAIMFLICTIVKQVKKSDGRAGFKFQIWYGSNKNDKAGKKNS